MLTPIEAEGLIREHLAPFQPEDCPLAAAHGRVLRSEIRADRDLPPFDRVTLDGFALRAAALAAGTTRFRIEQVQPAGRPALVLGPATEACIEVMTGAVLSIGADCIVPYEETRREGDTLIVIGETRRLISGHAVHHRGGDHRAGEVLITSGTRLTGREIAVAAACGCRVLTVSRVPKIAIVATGDELVEVESGVAAHQIRRSNDYALSAALVLAGYPNVARFHLRDVPHEIEQQLRHILAEFDVIVASGGISKGKFDFLPGELERQGVKKIFQGVAQKPGKPLWFGLTVRQTPVFALPGNPVSAYTCLHRYILPALAAASGLPAAPPSRVALAAAVKFSPKLAYFLPVKLSSGPAGESIATPDPSNTSGDFAGLLGTDGFVELPAEQNEFPAGSIVPFRRW